MGRRLAALAAISSCALTLAACGATHADKPKTFAVHGIVNLMDIDGFTHPDGSSCSGSSGYDDISSGAQVTISDAGGKTIALGELRDGELISDGELAVACQFPFTVRRVPAGKKFYGVEVSHRGVVRYTSQDAHDRVRLTLGG